MLKTFIKILIVGTITYLVFQSPVSYAIAPERTLKDYSVPELIAHFASQYDVSASQMTKTIKCESNFITDVQSKHRYKFTDAKRGIYKGQQELSFGLVQIHLPAHPTVTKDQAIDPVFAIEFMAKNFAEGRQRMWTCAR